MPDLLRTAELTAKAIRNGFAFLGATVDACIPAKVNVYRELHQAADALAEREAEEEVAELWAPPGGNSQTLIWASPLSATFNDEPSDEALNNITGLCCCYDPRVLQPCGPCRLGDGPCVNLPQSPAVSATDSAVEDLPDGCPPRPSGTDSLTWTDWATPAIGDVMADHQVRVWGGVEPIKCFTADGAMCARFNDWQEWREHVAPLIAKRLESAAAQRDGGLRNISFASEFYEQHKK